ncbi:MAG: hypothetical protein ACI8PZ_001324 [Myxococcota bacterium]|jgi:hypothetical protein
MWLWILATAAMAACPVVPSADGVDLMLSRVVLPLDASGSESVTGLALADRRQAMVGAPMWEETRVWAGGAATVTAEDLLVLAGRHEADVDAWFAARRSDAGEDGPIERGRGDDGTLVLTVARSEDGTWTRTGVAVLPDRSVIGLSATLSGPAAADASCQAVLTAALSQLRPGERPRDLGGYRASLELLVAQGTLELDVRDRMALHHELSPDHARYAARDWERLDTPEPTTALTFTLSRETGPKPDAGKRKVAGGRVFDRPVVWRQDRDVPNREVAVLKSAAFGSPPRWVRVVVESPASIRREALREIAEQATVAVWWVGP